VVFAPLAWSMGVPWKEAGTAGGLLGVKLILTEFTAFIQLAKVGHGAARRAHPDDPDLRPVRLRQHRLGRHERGRLLACWCRERRQEVLGLVWKAMMAGFLATCLTGSLIGLMPRALFGL
jgi:CNT family concentrative nucleoside transporter